VRICCAVGSLVWTVWDDALEKEGEVGSGEMEETECRCELEQTKAVSHFNNRNGPKHTLFPLLEVVYCQIS
jgi:hypothetical protein